MRQGDSANEESNVDDEKLQEAQMRRGRKRWPWRHTGHGPMHLRDVALEL